MKDPAFPSTEHLEQMKHDFKDGNSAIFIIANHQSDVPLNYKQFCAIRNWVRTERYSNHDLKSVFSPFSFRKPVLDEDRLLYPVLMEVDCEKQASSMAPVKEMSLLLDSPWKRVITNPKLSDIAIEFIYSDLDQPGRFGRFDPSAIGKTLSRAEKALENSGLKVYLGGKSAPEYQFMEAIKRDNLVNLLVAVLAIILLRIFYGTWSSGIAFVFTVTLAFLPVLGGMGYFGIPLDLLSANLFLMLCISGMEDIVFVLQEQADHGDWRRSFKKLLLPSFLTSLTTFIGFVSLYTSDLHMIQRFGVAAGIGAMLEWIATFFVLPTVLAVLPKTFKFVDPNRAWKPRWLLTLKEFAPRRSLRMLSMLVFVGGVIGWFYLDYEDSLNTNFPRGHLQRETYLHTKATRGWEGIANIVFPASMIEAERVGVLDEIEKSDRVKAVETSDEIIRYVRRGLPPTTADLAERNISLNPAVSRYRTDFGDSRATVYLTDFNLSSLLSLSREVDRLCEGKGCYAAGEGLVYSEFSEKVIETLLESFLTSIWFVGLTLFLIGYRLPLASRIKMMFTSLWGPVVMIGVMALFKVPVSQATSLFAAVLIGLTGDNAIQYICAGRDDSLAKDSLTKGVDRRAVASIQLGAILCVLSLSFLFLTLIPMRTLGVLFFGGFLVTLVGDLWLLKGFIEDESRTNG